MLKSEYLDKKRRWFQERYGEDTWEAEWNKWVEDTPMEKVPGRDHPHDVFTPLVADDVKVVIVDDPAIDGEKEVEEPPYPEDSVPEVKEPEIAPEPVEKPKPKEMYGDLNVRKGKVQAVGVKWTGPTLPKSKRRRKT